MSHHHHHHDSKTGHFGIAFGLNLSFAVIELIGGLLTNSMAIMADAIHDIGDAFSLGLAWYLEKLSLKKSDATFSYGYRRFSLLATVINGIVLSTATALILIKSVPRLWHPSEINLEGMIFFACLGIVFNGIGVLKMMKKKGLNSHMIRWHLLEDVLGWVAILIVTLVMMVKPWTILDPLLSIIIALVVVWNVYKMVLQAIRILLQGVPNTIDPKGLDDDILSLTHVQSLHHSHLWTIDGDHHVFSAHVEVEDTCSHEAMKDIKLSIYRLCKEKNIGHVTLEIEHSSDVCNMKDISC